MDLRKLSKIKDAVSEIQIPTKQELIDHFRKLGEDLKKNPNLVDKPYIAEYYSIKRPLGEWSTHLSVEPPYKSDEKARWKLNMSIELDVQRNSPGKKVTNLHSSGGAFKPREWLEQNWERILEESAESIIRILNEEIDLRLRLRKYVKNPKQD